MELLLGLTLLHTSLLAAAENRVNGQVILSRSTEAKATQGYFSGGLGLRYPFGRHFEGVLDWTYSRNVQSASEGVHLNAVGNKLGLTRALSLGLRYRFAVKKKVAVASGS